MIKTLDFFCKKIYMFSLFMLFPESSFTRGGHVSVLSLRTPPRYPSRVLRVKTGDGWRRGPRREDTRPKVFSGQVGSPVPWMSLPPRPQDDPVRPQPLPPTPSSRPPRTQEDVSTTEGLSGLSTSRDPSGALRHPCSGSVTGGPSPSTTD